MNRACSRSPAASSRIDERHAGPLADRAPALDAVVAGDLGAPRQAHDLRRATGQRPLHQPVDRAAASRRSARRRAGDIPSPCGIGVAVGPEHRRQVGCGEFARQARPVGDQPLRLHRQPLGRAQRRAEGRAVVEPVAAGEQQPPAPPASEHARRVIMAGSLCARQAVPAGDHRADLVDRPGEHDHHDMDQDEGDQQHRRTRKWIERADWRPPNRSSSHGQAAFMPGDMVRPVRITSGSSTKITPK